MAEPQEFAASPGRGVTARSGGMEIIAGTRPFLEEHGLHVNDLALVEDMASSEVVVAEGGRVLGSIVIADALRDEAVTAVRELRSLGIRTVLLSGDRSSAASTIAGQLGVDDFAGSMMPDQKARLCPHARRFRPEGRDGGRRCQ